MAPALSVPSQIAGFTVLPIALPPLPSFPTKATHYLYLSPHQPKIPEPNAERSLFLVNVPFSSTEIHVKHLLSKQLGLPAGRIEEVRFEGKRGRDGHNNESDLEGKILPVKGKKRKRGNKVSRREQIEGAELPSTWDRELLTGNLTAIVLFIDKSSAGAVLKAAKRAKKENMEPVWGEGLGDMVPPLGSASSF
jgi:ribosomal RNA-processing protein 7